MNLDRVTEIATVIGTLLAGAYICYKVCKTKIEAFIANFQGSVSSKVPKQSKIDTKVLKRMEEVKELLNADRVHVYEFHNGEHYANGRSALKISCTYEVCKAGVKIIQRECLSMPISCTPKYIANILDSSIVEIKDIENIKDSMPASYNFKIAQDVKAFTDVVIQNKQKEPVGFIEIQWLDKKNFVRNEHELLRLAAFIEESILSIDNQEGGNK